MGAVGDRARGGIAGVLDAELMMHQDHDEAEHVFHIAIRCVAGEAGVRPTMPQVVTMLETLTPQTGQIQN